MPARCAATSGTGVMSQRTTSVPSAARRAASASTPEIARSWTSAARSRVAGPSVAELSPGGLIAPASETCGSRSAGRARRSRQWSKRLGSQRMTTATSAGILLITATDRFRWPKPWLVT